LPERLKHLTKAGKKKSSASVVMASHQDRIMEDDVGDSGTEEQAYPEAIFK
jgi:hypothetical protein